MSNFDWRQVVAESTPGPTSSANLIRQERLARLMPELSEWAARYALSDRFLKSTVYFNVVSCSPLSPYSLLRALAKQILWIFCFDDYVDSLNYTQPEATQYLDTQLAVILEPLYYPGGLTPEQAETWHLPRRDATASLEGVSEESHRLNRALLDLYAELDQTWTTLYPDDPPENQQFRRHNFSLQSAVTLGAMRHELYQLYYYQQNHQLPALTLEDYLETGRLSIGAPPATALLTGFEPAPIASWDSHQELLMSYERTMRFANDLGNYWNELTEGKISSLTLALAQLNFPPFGDYEPGSPEVAEARQLIQQQLDQELANLIKLLGGPPDPTNSLEYYYWHSTAINLAMYEKGNFLTPTNQSTTEE